MKTHIEVEALAAKLVSGFLTECRVETRQDIANALMKLCSVAGVTMGNSVGMAECYERMSATAAFCASKSPDQPAALVPIQ